MHTARDTGRARADNPAIPSRRGMLAAGAAALVAGAAIATAAHGQGANLRLELDAGDDLLVALCCRLDALEAKLALIERRHGELRGEMVTRWGEPSGSLSGEQLWGHDPRYPELDELGNESDRYVDHITALTDEIEKTAPTTMAGLQLKARIATGLWPGYYDNPESGSWPDHHESFAFAVLRDVERLLDGRTAA